MRNIEVDLEVYSRIWANRRDGENDENAILRRLVLVPTEGAAVPANPAPITKPEPPLIERINSVVEHPPSNTQLPSAKGTWAQATWLSDVFDALWALGCEANLEDIYSAVRMLRRTAKRSLPPTTTAVIRRTLEDHSSDSDNFRGGRNLFCMPRGKGNGFWAIRPSMRGS